MYRRKCFILNQVVICHYCMLWRKDTTMHKSYIFFWVYYNNFIIGAWLSSWSQGAGSVWGQVRSLSVWCVLFLSKRLLITLPKCTINRLDISVQYLIWCWRKYEALSLRVTVFTVCFVESPFHLKQKPMRRCKHRKHQHSEHLRIYANATNIGHDTNLRGSRCREIKRSLLWETEERRGR